MPTYEYQCKSCGTHHDVVQKFGDDPLTECPSCGGPLRKVFGAVGVVFKGSGFYKTDSRTSAKKSDRSDKSDKSDKSEKSDRPRSPTRRPRRRQTTRARGTSDSPASKSGDSASKPGATTSAGSAAAAS